MWLKSHQQNFLQTKYFQILCLIIFLTLTTILCTFTTNAQEIPITQQQQQHAPVVNHPLRGLSSKQAPIDWTNALSILLSWQRLNIAEKFGPFGEHRHDGKYLQQIQNDIPEFRHMFGKHALPPLESTTQQPHLRIYDFHNFLHNMTLSMKSNNDVPPLDGIVIDSVSTNFQGETLRSLMLEQSINTKQFDQTQLDNYIIDYTVTPDTAKAMDRTLVDSAYKSQNQAFQFASKYLPNQPYIRMEITSADDTKLDAFNAWLKSYTTRSEGMGQVIMRYATFPRISGGFGNTRQMHHSIIYIEPDSLILQGKRYSRASSHGENAGILMLVIMFLIIGSQLFFQWWQHTHESSYDQFIVLCLWLVPLGVAVLDNFKRFLIIWWCYTAITALVLSLLFVDLNPLINKFLNALDALSDDTTSNQNNTNTPNFDNNFNLSQPNQQQSKLQYVIPQRYIFSIVYKYFLLVHKFIMVLLTISVAIFFLDIFGFFQFLGLEPFAVGTMFRGHEATAEEVLTFIMFAMYGLFYSIYFGVLNRDIATIVIPQLTLISTKFKITRDFKKKQNQMDKIEGTNDKNDKNVEKKQLLSTSTAKTASTIEMSTIGAGDTHDRTMKNSEFEPNWDNVGNILGNDLNNGENATVLTATTTTTSQNLPSQQQSPEDVEAFFSQPTTGTNHQHTHIDAKGNKIGPTLASKTNSCGICHELLKSKTEDETLLTDGSKATTTSLPTINEIRSRLRRQNQSGSAEGSGKSPISSCGTKFFTLIFSTFTSVLFWFIDFCDNITGGSGNVNIDSVTIVEGMYTIQVPGDKDKKKQKEDEKKKKQYAVDDYEYDDDDDINNGSSLISSGFGASTRDNDSNTLQTNDNNNVVFQLPCGCFVHDMCLRGFMLLGKHNICPSCKELSSFDVFVSPWDSIYDNYKHLLDSIKYFIAINPLLLFIINILLYFFW